MTFWFLLFRRIAAIGERMDRILFPPCEAAEKTVTHPPAH